jgi:hypothetical protein
MATSFPNGLDSLTNPSSTDLLNQSGRDHTSQHININDAIEAIEARIGIEGTTDNQSLEYRLNLVESISGTSVLIQDVAADWASLNPILEVYQIGVESDTLKMKFGNGQNWNDIGYSNVTPSQLGNNLDLYIPVGDRGAALGVASLDANALVPDSQIPSSITRDSELSAHASDTTDIHGIADTSLLATKSYADNAASTVNSSLSSHASDTTNIHGITDTSALLTTAGGTVDNLTVTGNLAVQGTTTTVNSTNLEVTDSLVYLASQQFDTDVLDIGIFGAYGDVQAGHLHTGLVRDATDGKWKLVSNATEPTDSSLDFTGVTYDTLILGGLEVGSVSNTEIGYLNGVTSSIQSQIDGKQDIVSGVSSTEIGYLDGVTSSIQTQLDTKSNSLVQFNQQSSSYTIQLSDKDKVVEMSGGGTLTIPAEASVSLPNGFAVEILQTGSSQVTIAGSGFTPNATPGLKLRAQWSSATLLKRGSDLWVVTGDLSA